MLYVCTSPIHSQEASSAVEATDASSTWAGEQIKGSDVNEWCSFRLCCCLQREEAAAHFRGENIRISAAFEFPNVPDCDSALSAKTKPLRNQWEI